MKTIIRTVRTISIPLGVAAVSGMLAINARAIEVDPAAKTEARPETTHGAKAIHWTEAKVDKLATLLKQHTKKAADATEAVAKRTATHVENLGHKVSDATKKTADKIEEKIDHLTE